MNSKKWFIKSILSSFILLLFFAITTIIVDPLFHYHYPLSFLAYKIEHQRYQNNGILRHWNYDTIITGSSMTENFSTAECDEIFGTKSIKSPFSGCFYPEINRALNQAYSYKKDIRMVIRSIDYTYLVMDKDTDKEDVSRVDYLSDKNPFNDVEYLLNKSIYNNYVIDTVHYSLNGGHTTTMDEYSYFAGRAPYGKEAVLSRYSFDKIATTKIELSEEEKDVVRNNIIQNVTDLADTHPETTFYLFFPPYSIVYWAHLSEGDTSMTGGLGNDSEKNNLIDWRIDAEQVAIEEILNHPNIKLYSFCDNYELTCNLDNYEDQIHYGDWINSDILHWMKEDVGLLTKDNYRNYINGIRNFYNNYNYNDLINQDQ